VREIGRGGKTKAASTRRIPIKMVTVKEVNLALPSSTVLSYRHQNLVEIIELYKFEGKTLLISEYAQVSLKRVIAIPLDLKEVHISTICSQARLTYPSFERETNLQIFDGMEFLATHQLSFNSLNTSNILCFSNGTIKIGIYLHSKKRLWLLK
jgi:hypothetical protein